MPSIRTIAVLAALSIVLSAGGIGCSGKRVMVRTARTLLPDAMAAFNDEPDRELARTAGFSNLKYLETLHRAAPGDQEILVALAQAFGGMAVAFLEDDMEAARGVDEARFDEARQRAAAFYRRGQEYAGQALELRHPGILQKLEGGGADQALRELNGDDLPALFWYAFDQGGALWLSRSEPAALRELPLNRRLILRAIELTPRCRRCSAARWRPATCSSAGPSRSQTAGSCWPASFTPGSWPCPPVIGNGSTTNSMRCSPPPSTSFPATGCSPSWPNAGRSG